MANKGSYIYCNVLPANYQSAYYYICDFEVKPGDIVIIPLRAENTEKVGLVLDVNSYTEYNAPYPPMRTKHISRFFGENEPDRLQKEKREIEEVKEIRFMAESQLEKLRIKESLQKYAVGNDKTNIKKIQKMIEAIPESAETVNGILTDLYKGIILSDDRKTVIGYKDKKNRYGKTVIIIPSGVEAIEDDAFFRVNIDYLFLPKELRYLGKYTINHPVGYDPYKINPKKIESIVVEDGNRYFMSDESGFYSLENGKKELLRQLDKNISVFKLPSDVDSIAKDAFAGCSNLKQIVLSDGVKSFDEYSLPDDTQVKEVFLSKSVEKLRTKSMIGPYAFWHTVIYRIDEDNPRLFIDEDSVYEVLEDGSFRLMTCFYKGKGKVLFLEGTSIIGAGAFEGHSNITKLELPKSLRIIERNAFAHCIKLKSVKICSELENIGLDAFLGCKELRSVKSEGPCAYSYNNGVLRKKLSHE